MLVTKIEIGKDSAVRIILTAKSIKRLLHNQSYTPFSIENNAALSKPQ